MSEAKPPAGTSGRDIRAVSRDLADADDAQIARVVAMVDQMPQRGGADQLIEPLRPRLAQLRPRRPLRFTRLLFLPLDPLIVPARLWNPTLPTIPRSVLICLAATVQDGLGPELAAIDSLLPVNAWHEPALIARAGGLLWPRAAGLLAMTPAPIHWVETGLNQALYPMLARQVAAVLAQAPVLQELMDEADAGIAPPRLGPVREMLAGVAASCPEAQTMLVALLLARLPQLAPLLPAAVTGNDPQMEAMLRLASERATEALLQKLESAGGVEAAISTGTLAESARAVRRTVALLHEIATGPNGVRRHKWLREIHQRLDTSSRNRFDHALSSEFLAPLQHDNASAAKLEATARHLRELESEARNLGGGTAFDAALRQAAATVKARDGLGLPERVRLVEILLGPEAALAWLG